MSDATAGPTVVGVDGCPGGWIAVRRSPEGLTADRVEDVDHLITELRAGSIDAMAIDMPIGLLDVQPRPGEREARAMLGPRRSSVFPTPVRATLAAVDYADACRLSRQVSQKALSKQAYNLLPKIRRLDELVRPEDQDRLVEAHPECAFVRLAGEPLAEPKRTVAGRKLRRRLLINDNADFATLFDSNPHLPLLDLIDAAVLTITAAHVVAGSEHRLGTEFDARGLAARIVF